MSDLSKKELALREAITSLTDEEVFAYNYWLESKKPSLAPSLNLKLFELYLNGSSCAEIQKLNPALDLGTIVSARLQGLWDHRRDEYLDSLLENTSLRVKQATLESAVLICDMLAAANKLHGQKLRKFLQTGDERELGALGIDSLRDFKQAVEIMQKLSGQERQQQVNVSGTVQHTATPVTEDDEAASSSSANDILKKLLGNGK